MKNLSEVKPDQMPAYTPCEPCADSEFLATQGIRIMFRHTHHASHGSKPVLFLAEMGMVYAGWVIGVSTGSIQEIA
jgi:hypothetical protein